VDPLYSQRQKQRRETNVVKEYARSVESSMVPFGLLSFRKTSSNNVANIKWPNNHAFMSKDLIV